LNNLADIYRRLATNCSREQLSSQYRAAKRCGRELSDGPDRQLAGPTVLLASAIPACATASTAIHVLHVLPAGADGVVSKQLLDSTERNVADALQRCQSALERDGEAHSYSTGEWLPSLYDITAQILESAQPEPPTLVRAAQDAISWLSRALIELGEDSEEVPSSLVEVLARLLAVWVFTAVARTAD
jgi:hypothetical protein